MILFKDYKLDYKTKRLSEELIDFLFLQKQNIKTKNNEHEFPLTFTINSLSRFIITKKNTR